MRENVALQLSLTDMRLNERATLRAKGRSDLGAHALNLRPRSQGEPSREQLRMYGSLAGAVFQEYAEGQLFELPGSDRDPPVPQGRHDGLQRPERDVVVVKVDRRIGGADSQTKLEIGQDAACVCSPSMKQKSGHPGIDPGSTSLASESKHVIWTS